MNSSRDYKDDPHSKNFEYYPQDSHICRYLSKTEEHKRALNAALVKCRSKLISLSEDKVEVKLPSETRGYKSPPQICEECIENFMKRFSSWNEKLQVTLTDERNIKSVLHDYEDKCFGRWFKKSCTILVIGPTEVVAEVKQSVKNHPIKETTSDYAMACPFIYDSVERAIVRFVSRDDDHKAKLRDALVSFAEVEIKEENKVPRVHVIPCKNSLFMTDREFKQKCENILKTFFNSYDSWKKDFDKLQFKVVKQKTPGFVKTTSGCDHFAQWYEDTATVIVTGTCEGVRKCREDIEENFSAYLYSSRGFDSRPFSTPHSQRGYRTGGHIHSGNHHRQGLQRASSASCDNTRLIEIAFDTKNIKPAVLKYVHSNPETKKLLERCCKTPTKAILKNDQGHIQVHVIIKQNEDRREAFTEVQKYFEKFNSITRKYDQSKLKQVLDKQHSLFKGNSEVHVRPFPDTGTVKITGLLDKVTEKLEELDFEVNAEVMEETLEPDVFIAQRQCLVWQNAERELSQMMCKVRITPLAKGKIQYKCSDYAKAQRLVKDIYESLHREELNLSPGKIEFLRSMEKSQRESVDGGNNLLDPLYKALKDKVIDGALLFEGNKIILISLQSVNASSIIHQCIESFHIDLSGKKPEVPFSKKCKIIRERMEHEVFFMKEEPSSKKIHVFCLQNQASEVQMKIHEILNEIGNVEEVKEFFAMEDRCAKHICNPHSECRPYKAKAIQEHKQAGQTGLLVTCDKDDIESVAAEIDKLKNEITSIEREIQGYSLYEYLTKEEKKLRVEKETKCSIFLWQNAVRKVKQLCNVSIKRGNILDENCDAIVNSTGDGVAFNGQMSAELVAKYGQGVLDATLRNGTWVVPRQVYLCPTSSLLPWAYVLNVVTPGQSQMKKFIFDLLHAADTRGISSIAIPTVGAGKRGLEPYAVAQSMKEAFDEFFSGHAYGLTDIRIVVYEHDLFHVFKDIDVDLQETKSNGVVTKIYGRDKSNISEALSKLKRICDDAIKDVYLDAPSSSEFAHTKQWVEKICQENDVLLKWTKDRLHLQGLRDNVNQAREEIKKFNEAAVPLHWDPMNGQNMKKVFLNKGSKEYQAVKDRFKKSSPSYCSIFSIERIQNVNLYKQFKLRKEARQAETKQLFHGTDPSNVDHICTNNFDRGFAGANGTLYGRGVYFHVNSSYSVNYAGRGSSGCIFLADVITGKYAQGHPHYKAAPEMGSNKDQYDSVVDSPSDPKIFVVFRDASVYPLYLITFQRLNAV